MSTQDMSSTSCYIHPDRDAGVSCQRCNRRICPSCMNSASVGFHCPSCTKEGAQKVLRPSDLETQPYVTYALIAMSVLAFVAGIGLGDDVQARRFGGDGLTRDYGLWGPPIDLLNEWWRVFTSGFLHGGIFHLGMNMYALYLLGRGLEKHIGPLRFVLVYFASLSAGSFGALLLDPDVTTVGASGAIYGLFGLMVVQQLTAGRNIMQSGLGMVLGLNLVFTFGVPGISIGGHVGGLIGGALCGALLFSAPKAGIKLPKFAAEALMAVVLVAFFFGCLWAAGNWQDPPFNF